MKKLRWVFVGLFCLAGTVVAGVEDHLIYDKNNRHTLHGLDAVVKVEVLHYYAFSEPYIVHNFLHEMNRYRFDREKGCVGLGGHGTDYWEPEPYANAYILLLTHSIWVVDAQVTRYLDGHFETDRIRVALKNTPAFGPREHPRVVCSKDENITQMALGLVELDEAEFRLGFRGMQCFLSDSLEFISGTNTNRLTDIRFTTYKDTFERPPLHPLIRPPETNFTYCVMRDISIKKNVSADDLNEKDLANIRGYRMAEGSPLIKALEDALAEEATLMRTLDLKAPLPNLRVMDRLKEMKRLLKKTDSDFED